MLVPVVPVAVPLVPRAVLLVVVWPWVGAAVRALTGAGGGVGGCARGVRRFRTARAAASALGCTKRSWLAEGMTIPSAPAAVWMRSPEESRDTEAFSDAFWR